MEQIQSRADPPDSPLHLLADTRRRHTLGYLVDHPQEPVDLDEIAEHLHALSNPSASMTSDRDSLEVALHHSHLPKLADADVLDYDPESHVVFYRPDELVEELLQVTVEHFD